MTPDVLKDRPELAAAINRIRKANGDDSIVWGKDIYQGPLVRVPSGSLSFDLALGGGWPVNRVHGIVGHEAEGKTTIVTKTIAACQAADPEHICLWVAAEDFDQPWAEVCGMDMGRTIILEMNGMESVYDTVLAFLDEQLVDSIVIDSLAMLVPEKEGNDDMEDFHVGLAARLNGKFFRMQRAAARRSLVHDERACTMFVINQWREKIGVMYGDPRTAPGGKAKDFAYCIRVEVKKDDWLEDEHKQKVGQVIKILTTKNKTFPRYRVGQVDFYFDQCGDVLPGMYDTANEAVAIGIDLGVVGRKGNTYSYGDQSWVGRAKAMAGFAADPELREKLRLDVMARTAPALEPVPAETPKRVVKKKAADA